MTKQNYATSVTGVGAAAREARRGPVGAASCAGRAGRRAIPSRRITATMPAKSRRAAGRGCLCRECPPPTITGCRTTRRSAMQTAEVGSASTGSSPAGEGKWLALPRMMTTGNP